jgi:hypothetical protein
MPVMSKPSASAHLAIVYITLGALLDVWSGVWYWYLRNHPPAHDWPYYLCTGLVLTGSILILIGLALGRIGRAARKAELPPPEVTQAVKQAEQLAAARAPMAAPANPVQQPPAPVVSPPPVAGSVPQVPPGTLAVNT